VAGDLNLWNHAALTNLDGLSNLSSVGGDLRIHDNPGLCQTFVYAFIAACTLAGSVQDILGNDSGC